MLFAYSLGSRFAQKSGKQQYKGSMYRAYENGSTKDVILECFKPRKLGPRACKSTILGFEPLQKKLHFVGVLDSHFRLLVNSIRRNHGF